MAQQVNVLLIDDLDGGDAHETIGFALDGTTYEIDLSTANAKKMRGDIAPYVEKARKAGHAAPNGPAKSRRRDAGQRARTAEIRAWASVRGYSVSDRGRISPKIIAEYDAVNA